MPRQEHADSSPFELVKMRVQLSVLPCFLDKTMQGVHECLNALLMRYNDDLGGVLLAYSDVQLLEPSGRILYHMPHIHCSVKYKALVFRPQKDMILTGRVNKVGANHVGLLVCGIFNASIPADELPDHYSFDGASEAWVSSKSDDDTIVVGREIRFSVERLHEAAGLISISASMKQPGTGPTAAPVEETPPELQLLQSVGDGAAVDDEAEAAVAAMDDAAAVASAGEAAAPATPATSKRRKRPRPSVEPAQDSAPPASAKRAREQAQAPAQSPAAAPEPVPHAKKKRRSAQANGSAAVVEAEAPAAPTPATGEKKRSKKRRGSTA